MKILVIGDIYAKPGRDMLEKILPNILKEKQIDFTIANGENITHGKGIKKQHFLFLKSIGVNCITGGNHSFKNSEIFDFINEKEIVVPGNFNSTSSKNGSKLYNVKNKTIRVTNLLGRVFMENSENPYILMEKYVENKQDIHIVDFHAEASAEKVAFANYFDGKINALVGTHTHVQTADERLLPNGTAFITDLGMTGVIDSVIGVKKDLIIKKERLNYAVKFEPAVGKCWMGAVIIEIDDKTNKTISIERLLIKE